MKFWDTIKNLFQESEKSTPAQPAIHHLIQREAEFIQQYELWVNRLVKKRLFNWLSEQYAIYLTSPNDIDKGIDFLNTPSSKGFVIHFYKTNYTNQEGQFLLDYLKDKVLELSYLKQLSDVRSYNRPNWVETVERHYLKPQPIFKEGEKINQKFGNIKIELLFKNEKVHQLKFSATIYKDHLYADASRFEALMQHILH